MAATEVRERDLDAEIAALDRKRSHQIRVTGHSVIGRIYATHQLHQLVPHRLALSIAWAIGWLRWYWPPVRRRAIGRVSLTVAGTPREGEVRKLAHRELSIQAMRFELGWRYQIFDDVPIEGRDRLERALSSGRPTLITGAHVGGGITQVMAQSGIGLYGAAGTWLDPDARVEWRGYRGYQARAWLQWCEAFRFRLVTAGDSYVLLRELLERGEPCWVMSDVPGRMSTRMAGKAAQVASGPAMLAHETGALVVPMVGLLHTGGPRVQVLEPIDSRTMSGPQEIADRLAEIFGEQMIRHPEQVDPTGYLKYVFAEDGADCPPDLWHQPALRTRVKLAVRGLLSRARQQLGA